MVYINNLLSEILTPVNFYLQNCGILGSNYNYTHNISEKPGFLDFKGKSKWEAWNKLKGTSSDEAKQNYVKKVQELISQVGLK